MKTVLIILLTSFSYVSLQALSCPESILNVHPNNDWLSEKPVILIEWMERDYNVYDEVDQLEYYLINDEGDKIPLEILDKTYAGNTYAQVLLSAQSELNNESEVAIIVEGERARINGKFVNRVEKDRCWKVKQLSDDIKPIIEDTLEYKSRSRLVGIYSTFSTRFTIPYCENIGGGGLFRNSDKDLVFAKVITDQNKVHYFPVIDCQFSIYKGLCGKTFDLNYCTNYVYKLQLIDLSGNWSQEEIAFAFQTPDSKKMCFEEIESNGVKGVRQYPCNDP